ncbi:hypothetical protein [Streptomyces sp. NPDC008150]|uniref:hypothetical protein n=1 Tax=Streptomyces sp. NPDC008150 TaxID=3364816 RepID=UPI0036EF014F
MVAARATLGLCGLANLVQAVWHRGSAAWDVTRIVVSTLFLVALFSLLVRFFAERRRLRHGDAD